MFRDHTAGLESVWPAYDGFITFDACVCKCMLAPVQAWLPKDALPPSFSTFPTIAGDLQI